jgi:hypothetical protein
MEGRDTHVNNESKEGNKKGNARMKRRETETKKKENI